MLAFSRSTLGEQQPALNFDSFAWDNESLTQEDLRDLTYYRAGKLTSDDRLQALEKKCPPRSLASDSYIDLLQGIGRLKFRDASSSKHAVQLCKVCRRLDLDRQFTIGHRNLSGSDHRGTKVELGSLEEIKARQSCVFCAWLTECLEASGVNESAPGIHRMHIPIELSIEREHDFDKNSWYTIGRIRFCGSSGPDIAELRNSSTEDAGDQKSRSSKNVTVSKMFGPTEPSDTTSTLVRQWLNQCMHGHTTCWLTYITTTSDMLRVIDTRTRQVLPKPPGSPYLALSYVWGGVQQATVRADGTIAENLPATIQDAIAFTAALGFRYLWVDAFGVSTEGHDARMQDIKCMDVIYSNAVAVIIAAAGEDANHGLPGVSRRTKPYRSFKFPNTVLQCRSLDDSMPSLASLSPYVNRCWTLQESLLAARRIIFTEEEILFECGLATGRERLGSQFCSADFHSFLFGSLGEMHIITFAAQEWRNTYQAVLHRFLNRSLTYEYDVKNAFQGISNYIARSLNDTSCWTIPRKGLLWGLLWCPYERCRDRAYDSERPGNYLIEYTNAGIRRRENATDGCSFPSWFWGAWVMENASWVDDFSNIRAPDDLWSSIAADDYMSAAVRDWDEERWSVIEKTGILTLDAELVNMSQNHLLGPIDERFYLPRGAEQKHWDAKSCVFLTIPAWKTTGMWASRVSALAIIFNNGIAYRVGHLAVRQKDWEEAGPIQQTVKLG